MRGYPCPPPPPAVAPFPIPVPSPAPVRVPVTGCLGVHRAQAPEEPVVRVQALYPRHPRQDGPYSFPRGVRHADNPEIGRARLRGRVGARDPLPPAHPPQRAGDSLFQLLLKRVLPEEH